MRTYLTALSIVLAGLLATQLSLAAADDEQKTKPAAEPAEQTGAEKTARKSNASADSDKARIAFHRLHLLEAYRKHGQRDARWDDQVEAFLDEWANRWADVIWRADPSVVLTLANAAIKAGCNDPLVRAGQVFAQFETDGTVTPKALELAQELAATKYAPYITAYCASLPVKLFEAKNNPNLEKQSASVELILSQVERSFQDDWIKPGDEQAAYPYLAAAIGCSGATWPDAAPRVQKLIDDAKEKHLQWMSRMLAATFCRKQGWAARGSGFAQTVTPEGWRVFHENIAQMVEHLRKAHGLMPQYPQAAADMITAVANGQGKEGETIYDWFTRAVEAEVDYGPAYSQMYNFARPRWGGDYELMEKVGKYGLDTERYDTWAPRQFFNALAAISRDIPRNEYNYWQTEVSKHYPQLERMFAGYEKSPEFKEFRFYFRSLHAVMAYHAGRLEEALAELKKTEDKVHSDALEHSYKSQSWFVTYVHAYGGVAGNKVKSAKKLLMEGKVDDAEKLLTEARQAYETEKDELALAMITNLQASVALQRKLQSNDWVDMTFDEQLTGWSKSYRKWKRVDDKTVSGTPSNGLQLSLVTPVGHRIQFRGEIQIPKLKFDSDNASIVVATSSKPVLRGVRFSIYPQPDQPRYYLGIAYGDNRNEHRPTDVRLDKNTFDIVLWDDTLRIKLNGDVIQRVRWLREGEEFGEEEGLGLSGAYLGEGPEVLFRNLQLRRLLNPPEDF